VMSEVPFFTGLKLNGGHRLSPADAGNGDTIDKIGALRRSVVDNERHVGVLQHVAVFAGKAGCSDKNAPQIIGSRKGDNIAVGVPV
jgi:hypothetical protein